MKRHGMLFDISKTETFVPFLWIVVKTLSIVLLLGGFSSAFFPWEESPKMNAPELGRTGTNETIDWKTRPHLQAMDKTIAVTILLLVLCERGIDVYVVSRSDVAQKIARTTMTGLNTHVCTDIFLAFCLVQGCRNNFFMCEQQIIFWCLCNSWFGLGQCIFLVETRMKIHAVRTIQQLKQHDGDSKGDQYDQTCDISLANNCLLSSRGSVSRGVLYVSCLVFMSLSIISPCLCQMYSEMLYVEYYMRLFLYGFYVCVRCYTEGMPGESFIHGIPNVVLFGWTIMIPRMCLYLSIFLTVLSFTIAVAVLVPSNFLPSKTNSPVSFAEVSPSYAKKQTHAVSREPHTDTDSHIHPTLLPEATLESSPSNTHQSSNVLQQNHFNNTDLLSKLRDMEENMGGNELASSTDKAVFSHSTKQRRQHPLF